MKFSPRDIARKEFARSMRGYDPAEVRSFLEQLSDEVYDLQRELAKAPDVRPHADPSADTASSGPSGTESLDALREEIERERARIIHEAQLEASQLKQEAQRELARLHEDIRNLRTHRDGYVKRLRLLLKSQVELLDLLENETPESADDRSENPAR